MEFVMSDYKVGDYIEATVERTGDKIRIGKVREGNIFSDTLFIIFGIAIIIIMVILGKILPNLVDHYVFPNTGIICFVIAAISALIIFLKNETRTITNFMGGAISVITISIVGYLYQNTFSVDGSTFLNWIKGFLPNLIYCAIVAAVAGLYQLIMRRNELKVALRTAKIGIATLSIITFLKIMFALDSGSAPSQGSLLGDIIMFIVTFPVSLILTLLAAAISTVPSHLILRLFEKLSTWLEPEH